MAKKPDDDYDEKEAQPRFEAALRGGPNTPQEKPAAKKPKKAKKKSR